MLHLAAVHGMLVNVQQPDLQGENTRSLQRSPIPVVSILPTMADFHATHLALLNAELGRGGHVRQCESIGAGFPLEYQLHGKRIIDCFKIKDQLFKFTVVFPAV